MKLSIPQANPFALALAYGFLASAIVVGISFLEGTLYSERTAHHGSAAFIQYPYIYNVSTILDFAVFNPVAIFFLLKARNGFSQAFDHFKKGGALSPFNQAGIIFVSIAVGFSAMWFYFQGFVGKTFFSESFAAGPDGTAIVTFTGWAIFVFTSVFMSVVVLVMIEFGNYVLFVRSLGVDDFQFTLPPSVSEDIRVAATPCIFTMYVLATLFVVLSVFIFRDFYQFNIRESRRVWLFAPYVIACLVAFFPFWHLHRAMTAQKNSIIETNNSAIEKDISESKDATRGISKKIDPHKLRQMVDKIEKLQSFYGSIPVWPVTCNVVVLPNMSFLVSIITLLYKIADTFYAVGAK
jgi:uncharacterized membrane protein YqhA